MKGNLKNKLMLQSLSPLALLTIVRNFSFKMPGTNIQSEDQKIAFFITENKILIIVMIVCLGWIIAALLAFVSFSVFKWVDKKSGYEIFDITEKEDASLNFFTTMIIPLLIDDVGSIHGALTLAIIVVFMCALLGKTSLFYANPVLTILGYRVYEFSFTDNHDYKEKRCIGVVRGKLSGASVSVEYKTIAESVLYLKEICR